MSMEPHAPSSNPIDEFSVDSYMHDMLDDVLVQVMFLDHILAIIDTGVILFDRNGVLTRANDAAKEILGYDDDELVGLTPADLFYRLTECADPEWIEEILGTVKKHEISVHGKTGEHLHLVIGARRLRNERDEFAGHVLSLTNITEQKNLQLALSEKNKRLAKVANRDALTGLFNRLYFEDALAQKVLESRRYGTGLSLAMIDIDHFKRFNDTYGHLAGDEVLRRIAGIMAEGCRAADIVARYGGEEFALILPATSGDDAFPVADRLRGLIEAHVVRYKDEDLRMTVSIGVASFDAARHDAQETLVDEADAALYEAKKSGRNRVVIARPSR
jgi:diguanylate cyclase (GGDEF)-like protein/PAS domain S-box-containing protein